MTKDDQGTAKNDWEMTASDKAAGNGIFGGSSLTHGLYDMLCRSETFKIFDNWTESYWD